MNFSDLDTAVQNHIVEMLNSHLSTSADILKQDSFLIPMLMIPDSRQFISLQSADGGIDVDKAYARVVEKLRTESFHSALFSYSTRIGLSSGGETDALKTYIFTSDGIEVSFYTPYTIKGFFKKSVTIEQSILAGVKENIFG